MDSKKGSTDPTATLLLLEDVEKLIYIETIGKPRQDGTLSNTIGHAKGRGELVVPSDVCKLIDVNENEESDEDC